MSKLVKEAFEKSHVSNGRYNLALRSSLKPDEFDVRWNGTYGYDKMCYQNKAFKHGRYLILVHNESNIKVLCNDKDEL